VTRIFVRHAKKLDFEMRFHDIGASQLTILLDSGVAIPTVNACNTPIRANIVVPPNVATRIKGFHGRQPFRRFVLCLRKLRDVGPGIFKRDQLAATGSGIASSNRRDQPLAVGILRHDQAGAVVRIGRVTLGLLSG
jgi:hypothetical protein